MFFDGKSHGWRRLEGYGPWGHKESDTTERLTDLLCWNFFLRLSFSFQSSCRFRAKLGRSYRGFSRTPPPASPSTNVPPLLFLMLSGMAVLGLGSSTRDLCCVMGIFHYPDTLVAVFGLSCSVAHGTLVPRPGVEPASLASQGRFLTTGPPGMPPSPHADTPTPPGVHSFIRCWALHGFGQIHDDMYPPLLGFPDGSGVKNSPANAGDAGLIPGSGRPPGGGHGDPIQCSCLENPMGRGAWWAACSPWGRKELDTTGHTCTHPGSRPEESPVPAFHRRVPGSRLERCSPHSPAPGSLMGVWDQRCSLEDCGQPGG